MLNIKEFLKKYHKIEIEILLAEVLKKPKEFLFMNPEYRMSESQIVRLNKAIKRRQKGEPIAYILGYKDFYGLRFKVNKNVLVPRPETEGMVNIISNFQFPISNGLTKILDIGTGSGCIAITLAKQFQILNFKFQITASDISAKALAVAKQNAKAHRVKITFVKSDLLKNIKVTPDIIIANLPYVPRKYYESRIKNLGWEPKIALIDQKKDFDIYGRLLKQVAALPSLPKKIFLEIDPSQKKLMPKEIKKHLPKANVKFYKDFNNLWRFAEITI